MMLISACISLLNASVSKGAQFYMSEPARFIRNSLRKHSPTVQSSTDNRQLDNDDGRCQIRSASFLAK